MFVPVPSPDEIARWDDETIALGISENILMENAARAAMDCLKFHATQQKIPLNGAHILLLAGGGNNGGDAFCLARHLLDAGACPVLICTRSVSQYHGAAAYWLTIAIKLGITCCSSDDWEQGTAKTPAFPDIVIDGLLGTGFRGQLRASEKKLIEKINACPSKLTLALDIPSGLDPYTGHPSPCAVHAHVTVSFQAAKPGLLVPEAHPFTGILDIRPIGIPRVIQEKHPASFRTCLISEQSSRSSRIQENYSCHYQVEHLVSKNLMTLLENAAQISDDDISQPEYPLHKGDAGHVLILGGSDEYTGAPALTAWAALRSGAGLVTVAGPEQVLHAIHSSMPEITTLSILSKQNTVYDQPDITSINWDTICLAKLKQALSSAKSIVVGPGIGRSKAVADMITQLLLQPNLPPVVFDADALFAIAHKPELFSLLRPCDILTPHPGEAATILGITTKDIQKQRVTALKQLASLASSAWILKGAGTLISVHGKPITICPWNIPQLAVAGSGDILAGILGTLLAQGQSSETAAVKGVWIHAMCGIQLAHQFPMRGNSPMDIANAIPSILPLVDKI